MISKGELTGNLNNGSGDWGTVLMCREWGHSYFALTIVPDLSSGVPYQLMTLTQHPLPRLFASD